MVLDAFAHRCAASGAHPRFEGRFASCRVEGCEVGLLAPETYMNASGRSVEATLSEYPGLALEHLVVVHDDLDLPLGRLRLRGRGSAGGQRGLADIQAVLGTADIPRLRVGIGRPQAGVPVRDHVLSDFEPSEVKTLQAALDRAVEVLQRWIALGLDRAMDFANRAPEAEIPDTAR